MLQFVIETTKLISTSSFNYNLLKRTVTIFIGADHRGFDLKNKLIEYLQEKNIRVQDLGNYQYDPVDDHIDFGQKVAEAVLQNPSEFFGVVICGSGVGMSIAVNRIKGIRCVLGFNEDQIIHSRQNDHANILAIPSNFVDFELAKKFIDVFLATQPKTEEKYLRRLKKLDNSNI